MSAHIVVLSEEIANQIAAGEVVERPASIVKELIENSIDAQAKNISVEMEKGCGSIRVTDDGTGIDSKDVALVFERHATSKIRKIEDIYQVASFGFRGEAMPSIASVATVELLTKRQGQTEGTRAYVDAGVIKEISPAGCPAGTQITVSNIFANIPARRKFLKKENTEQSLCLDAVTRASLAYPEIRFRASVDDKEVFAVPQSAEIKQRVAAVMGMDFSANCIGVQGERENWKLSGFISHPEFTRSNSKNIYLFVNRRFVRDNSLIHAVLSAYRQIIPPRRYPAGVLFIDLPPQDVDVNVHPAKLEVRFKDARGIYEMVSGTIAQSLAQSSGPKDSFVYRLTPRGESFSAGAPVQPQKYFNKYPPAASRQEISAGLTFGKVVGKIASVSADDEQEKGRINFSGFSYIGQYGGTYLIFSADDGLLLIDQHAAHERIILEKLKKESTQKIASQRLLMPEIISLTPGQITLFAQHIDLLGEIGLDVEIFGKDSLAVKSLPALLSAAGAKEIVLDIADKLQEQNKASSLQEKKEELFASMACRAAIKAKNDLLPQEVNALCNDLENTPFNTTCPHGRPISIKISLDEIERIFKRK